MLDGATRIDQWTDRASCPIHIVNCPIIWERKCDVAFSGRPYPRQQATMGRREPVVTQNIEWFAFHSSGCIEQNLLIILVGKIVNPMPAGRPLRVIEIAFAIRNPPRLTTIAVHNVEIADSIDRVAV